VKDFAIRKRSGTTNARLSSSRLANAMNENSGEEFDRITDLGKARSEAEQFLARFDGGGAIWRIFWLHLWQPMRFPIYDQHVHRAMRFIQAGVIEETPERESEKIHSYTDQYLQFYARFDGINHREVDEALWTYGKFLSENNFPTEIRDQFRDQSPLIDRHRTSRIKRGELRESQKIGGFREK
jgi:hypothetical protein